MGIFMDLKGTTRNTFKILKALFDASGLTAPRTITLPDANVTFTGGSSGDVLTVGAGGAWTPVTPSAGGVTQVAFDNVDGNWTCPAGVTKAKIYIVGSVQNKITTGSALTDENRAYGWGINTFGETGDGNNSNTYSSPVAVVGGLKFKTIGWGYRSTKAVSEQGDAYCWGYNNYGQIGDNSITNKSSPTAVVGNIKFKKISGGERHTTALSVANDAYGWGGSNVYQVGGGTTGSFSSPVAVIGGLKFKDIAVGRYSSYGLTIAGDLYAWGSNTSGQLGTNDTITKSSPTLVVGGLKFKMVASGNFATHTIGIAENGDAYTWGDNSNGQLGNAASPTYATYSGVPDGCATSVTIDADYSGPDGNNINLTGDDASTINDIINAWNTANPGNSCTLTTGDGSQVPSSLWNTYLSGGSDDFINRSSPTAVIGGLKFKRVACNSSSTYGVTETGELYAWGTNTLGCLGDGTNTNRSSPVSVVGGLKYKDVTAHGSFAHALSVDSVLYSFGSNSDGELGVGDRTNRSSPTAVVGGHNWNRFIPFQKLYAIDVVPSTVYPVKVLATYAQFNNVLLDFFIDKMIIEY